jgi:protein TonB
VAYTYSIDDPAKNSKRTLAFVLVVIIHVLFFWVLASGLGAKIVEVAMGPVETKLIEELPDEDKEPPPPPPDIETPPPYVPPPEVSIDILPTPARRRQSAT